MIKKLLLVLVLMALLVGCGWTPSSDELVENGVQSITLCGKEKDSFDRISESWPGGTWTREKQGKCYVWYQVSESEED